MANNRMYMVCNVCNPTKNKWEDDNGILYMGKWYPDTEGGYVSMKDEELGNKIHTFWREHTHEELPSEHYLAGAGQENPVRIEYESDGLPIVYKNK